MKSSHIYSFLPLDLLCAQAYNIDMKSKTYEKLRIACSVIAAVILAATVFIFVYLGMVWGLVSLAVAGIFAALTFFFKNKQENLEHKDAPKKGDFITGSSENNDRQV